MRQFGAWIIPLGAIAGTVAGLLVAGVLNSDCNEAHEVFWGCTHYDSGRFGVIGAVPGALLGIIFWGRWYDEAREADEDRSEES